MKIEWITSRFFEVSRSEKVRYSKSADFFEMGVVYERYTYQGTHAEKREEKLRIQI